MFGSRVHAEEEAGLPPSAHVHTVGVDRRHVMDLFLDKTGGDSRKGHVGGDVSTYSG